MAQPSYPVATHHWTMEYLHFLQQRGYLNELHPTRLPWQYAEIQQAISSINVDELSATERHWYTLLADYYQTKEPAFFSFQSDGIVRRYNSDREELLRPHRNGKPVTPALRGGVLFGYESWAVRTGVTIDLAYAQDPDGLDVTHRLLGRTEDYFVAYYSDRLEIQFGRFDRHWGIWNRPAAGLSDNPRSYDAVSFRFGTRRFSVSSIWGQLDNLAATGSYFSRDRFEPGAKRRFISMHRFDWAVRPNLHLTFFEGVIYAGEQTGIELEYMNPLPIWAISQDGDPKNVYANLVIGAMGWWQYQNWTVHGEFFLDDIVVNERQEAQALRNFKPAAMAIMLNVQKAGIFDEFDAGGGFQLVSSTSYRSELFQGQWTYAQRGLGVNFSDYVQIDGFLRWHATRFVPGLQIEPYFEQLLQGEGDVRMPQSVTMPNGQNIPLVLSGTVSQYTRLALRTRYRYASYWAELDWGVNVLLNRYHREGFDETLFIGRITVGGSLEVRR